MFDDIDLVSIAAFSALMLLVWQKRIRL